MVVNGDVLTDLDVTELVAFHRDRGAEATVALTPVEDPSAFGVVPTDDEGRVVAFIEKPPPGQAPTNFINAGTYVLEPSVLARIPGDRRVSIERETFPALVGDGRLYALGSTADWVDAGHAGHVTWPPICATPAAYSEACGVAATASVTNSVLGEGVTVGAGAVVDSVGLLRRCNHRRRCGGALLDHRARRPPRIGRGGDRPLGRR